LSIVAGGGIIGQSSREPSQHPRHTRGRSSDISVNDGPSHKRILMKHWEDNIYAGYVLTQREDLGTALVSNFQSQCIDLL
jgi:hypothetical protein